MKEMKGYWHSVCPRCHGQGRLVICKRKVGGALFFHCDECEAAWDLAEDIGNTKKVFFGLDIPSTYANLTDIEEKGWKKYAKNEYFK